MNDGISPLNGKKTSGLPSVFVQRYRLYIQFRLNWYNGKASANLSKNLYINLPARVFSWANFLM